jgi:hypothetical protein
MQPEGEVNAVSLTGRFIGKMKSFLFHPVLSWEFSVWTNRFGRLDKNLPDFSNNHANSFI